MNLLEKMRLKRKANNRMTSDVSTASLMQKIETNDKRYRRTLYVSAMLFVGSLLMLAAFISSGLNDQIVENRTTVQQSQDAQTQVLLDSQDSLRRLGVKVDCLINALVTNRTGVDVVAICEQKAAETQVTPSQNFNHGSASGQTPGRTGTVPAEQRNQQPPPPTPTPEQCRARVLGVCIP